jgi:hypothetical protein
VCAGVNRGYDDGAGDRYNSGYDDGAGDKFNSGYVDGAGDKFNPLAPIIIPGAI